MDGKGIFYFINGDRYKGKWKSDLMDGKGIYYYNNDNKYKGYFKNSNEEGKRIYNLIMVIYIKEILKMV